MNCREAEHQIFAERDGALDQAQRAALAHHLRECTGCRAMRERFATAVDGLRLATRQTRVPDADLEWQKLRREIRGGAGSKAAAAATRRSPLKWIALPLAATAALAVALYVSPTGGDGISGEPVKVASAKNDRPATVVFVDDTSGYVFVWADDAKKL